MGDESGEVDNNNIPPVAGIVTAPQYFTNSQFFDVHGNYIVCDHCASAKISIIIIIHSKSTILQFLLK
jgi:hypothetical protein